MKKIDRQQRTPPDADPPLDPRSRPGCHWSLAQRMGQEPSEIGGRLHARGVRGVYSDDFMTTPFPVG
jgi:hypothetical protein